MPRSRNPRTASTTALKNSGYSWPDGRITINLAPADTKKEGPAFDLPLALGCLSATGQMLSDRLKDYAVVGELALDGSVRSVKGALSMAMTVREAGLKGLIVPADNAREAAVVADIEVVPVTALAQAVGFLTGDLPIEPCAGGPGRRLRGIAPRRRRLLRRARPGARQAGPDGRGRRRAQRPHDRPARQRQDDARAAAADDPADARPGGIARNHPHLLQRGPLGQGQAIIATRPFRSPHHTTSEAGLVGGGTIPTPGEVSLAHHGVLFLDELPEFNRHTLEVLRQPLEDGVVTISRAQASLTFPARIMLVAALNPCPCGYLTDPKRECHCTPRQVQAYMGKISGPLLDRIDIHLDVPAVPYRELRGKSDGTPSGAMREQVDRARDDPGQALRQPPRRRTPA